MGGRGASSSTGGGGGFTAAPRTIPTPTPQQTNNVANQAPSPQNTPVVPNAATVLSQMSDQQLTALYRMSQTIDMPNHLNDVDDATQKFVFAAGVNGKPTVLSDAEFQQYLKDNGIPQSQVLARTTGGANYMVNGTTITLTPTQVADLTKYGELNYVGGKHGGMAYGAGTYFSKNGGRPTGYGRGSTVTMVAVLSKNAKAIDETTLYKKTATWVQSHPQFANAVGRIRPQNQSIYALAQGFNVITDNYAYDYHNVIDRSALVMKQSNV